MKPGGSMSHSQGPSKDPYPEPNQPIHKTIQKKNGQSLETRKYSLRTYRNIHQMKLFNILL